MHNFDGSDPDSSGPGRGAPDSAGRGPAAEDGLHAWIDASAGIAGDMLLGALLDAGAPLGEVQLVIDAVLPGAVRITTRTVNRAGMRATKADVVAAVADYPHRDWAVIRGLLDRADLAEPVRDRAQRVFEFLARAEGAVHGLPPEHVHFHEVGAWDSIADVVGVCAALHLLGVTEVSASAVAVGSGIVSGAHGELAVPVPAVLEMSTGWSVLAGGNGELTTPTGMALVRTLAGCCEPLPAMWVSAVGLGAGTRDVAGRANVTRVVLGRRVPHGSGGDAQQMAEMQANVDDLDPRAWPTVLAALLAAGAADAWLVPILMKKGRPGHTVCVLAPTDRVNALRALMFAHTSTFGVREYTVQRRALERIRVPVPVGADTVRIKVSRDGDGRILHATPEFDDAAAAADRRGVPVRVVLEETIVAAARMGLAPGAAFPPAVSGVDHP